MRIPLNWGTAIAAVYGLFAATTVGFVAFAMGQPVQLVSPDYYRVSLQQDARLEAIANARALGDTVGVEIGMTGESLIVRLPAEHAAAAKGAVTFYRPSNTSFDRTVPLALSADARQQIRLTDTARGRWILQIAWTVHERPFYYEQALMLP
jgi:hypothetical protein